MHNPAIVRSNQKAAQSQTSTHALLALVLACAGVFLFLPMPIAIALGHIARSECNKNPTLKGRWMSTSALLIGYGYFAIAVGCVLVFLLVPTI